MNRRARQTASSAARSRRVSRRKTRFAASRTLGTTGRAQTTRTAPVGPVGPAEHRPPALRTVGSPACRSRTRQRRNPTSWSSPADSGTENDGIPMLRARRPRSRSSPLQRWSGPGRIARGAGGSRSARRRTHPCEPRNLDAALEAGGGSVYRRSGVGVGRAGQRRPDPQQRQRSGPAGGSLDRPVGKENARADECRCSQGGLCEAVERRVEQFGVGIQQHDSIAAGRYDTDVVRRRIRDSRRGGRRWSAPGASCGCLDVALGR